MWKPKCFISLLTKLLIIKIEEGLSLERRGHGDDFFLLKIHPVTITVKLKKLWTPKICLECLFCNKQSQARTLTTENGCIQAEYVFREELDQMLGNGKLRIIRKVFVTDCFGPRILSQSQQSEECETIWMVLLYDQSFTLWFFRSIT